MDYCTDYSKPKFWIPESKQILFENSLSAVRQDKEFPYYFLTSRDDGPIQ
jgi:hypothetical protein